MSLGSKRGRSARAVPYINVTPLIDVLLVMLIIFMVITPLKPSRFQADIPSPPDKDQPNVKTEPNPLTLVIGITGDLKIKLNNHDNPVAGETCFGVVPDYGSVNAPGNLAKCIHQIMQYRIEHHTYKDVYKLPNAPSATEEQKIERTVFIKAPRALTYGNVVKVIDAIKGAGANPVGLQLDGLDPS